MVKAVTVSSTTLGCSFGAYRRARPVSGFTLLELLVVMMLGAIMTSIAINNLDALSNPAQGAAAQLTGFLKEVRAKAISQTVAYKVTASSNRRIVTRFASTCSATTTTNDPSLTLNLPNSAALTATDWEICFTSRGLATVNTTITLQDQYVTKRVEVLLGGGVRTI